MAISKRKAKKAAAEHPAKRIAKARAARLQDDPEWNTTNAKSHLVNENLHAKYANPATYEEWTKEDWDEVRDCFPDDVPLNEDGYSVSMQYLKYDSNWRRLIREYQEDLGTGKYEAQWLAEAAQAMEDRAGGKFDKYKEDEFEEFWGQKQKLDWHHLAGESSKIKLEALLQDGVLRKGDELSYRRHFKRESGSLMVEKELKILEIDGSGMTIAIPPGQRRFAQLRSVKNDAENGQFEDRHDGTELVETDPENKAEKEDKHGMQEEDDHKIEKKDADAESMDLPSSQPSEAEQEKPPSRTAVVLDHRSKNATIAKSTNAVSPDTTSSPEANGAADTVPQDQLLDMIIERVNTLNSLERKILDIDGRVPAKEAPASSTWRALRARRNNQDLGSLFEMREEYFVWKDPKTVKTPSKRRRKGSEEDL